MDLINKPLGWLLAIFSRMFGGNYILTILFLALIFEIVLSPFAIKQQRNSIKQARLRPKEMAIRKKYAGRDDKPTQQKMQTEIQELYQKEGYNPMGGCLPLIIQMIIIFALYAVVVDPLKYISGLGTDAIKQISEITNVGTQRGSMELLGEIQRMGYEAFANVEGFTREIFDNMPNLTVFGIDMSLTPSGFMNLEGIKTPTGWVMLSIPVLTFLSYFFSMKINRKLMYQPMNDAQQAQMGCSNKMMDIVMPLFSVFLSFSVPAALGIYWIAKSVFGVLKQVVIYFAMPLPKFTDEDYKNAEKEINASRPAKAEKAAKSGRVVRSLHHIDDEDFEDTAEAGRRRREALEAQEAEKAEKTATKKNSLLSDARIKSEDDREAKKDKKSEEAPEADTQEAQSDKTDAE